MVVDHLLIEVSVVVVVVVVENILVKHFYIIFLKDLELVENNLNYVLVMMNIFVFHMNQKKVSHQMHKNHRMFVFEDKLFY